MSTSKQYKIMLKEIGEPILRAKNHNRKLMEARAIK